MLLQVQHPISCCLQYAIRRDCFAIEELTKTHLVFKICFVYRRHHCRPYCLKFVRGPYLYLGYPSFGCYALLDYVFNPSVAIITGIAGSGMGYTILFIFKRKKSTQNNFQTGIYIVFAD